MVEDPKEEEEEYNVKEELKEEGVFFGKRLIVNGVEALGQLGRGIINVGRKHPKVESLEEDVKEHIEEIKHIEEETA